MGRTLYLGESGHAQLDDVFIEFNGVLTEAGREAQLNRRLPGSRSPRGAGRGLWPLAAASGPERCQLVPLSARRSKSGQCCALRDRPAYFVDFSAGPNAFLQRRSANTRQQLRRSDRDYAKAGDVTLERAKNLPQAQEFLDQLAALHQASWAARGQPGAFANPCFTRFHRALVARGLGRGEIDLLRITAGPQTVGLLYNFRYRGHSLAYQSGFDLANARGHRKPGLTCHHQAIQFAARWGAVQYNFLAGDDRYKRSLADGAEELYWIEVTHPYSPQFLLRRLKVTWPAVVGAPGHGAAARSARRKSCQWAHLKV